MELVPSTIPESSENPNKVIYLVSRSTRWRIFWNVGDSVGNVVGFGDGLSDGTVVGMRYVGRGEGR